MGGLLGEPNGMLPTPPLKLLCVCVGGGGGGLAYAYADARPIGVQLKREAKLLTVIGLTTKHAYLELRAG